jgi:putative oxidoreductase
MPSAGHSELCAVGWYNGGQFSLKGKRMVIVPFHCQRCDTQFDEKDGGVCAKCGRTLCRRCLPRCIRKGAALCVDCAEPRTPTRPKAAFLASLTGTKAPAAVILIRILVGAVFLSEGIQKFLFPDELGTGRFIKIGIPGPEIMAPFVGVCEIVCGALLLLGILTRLSAVPMIVNMIVAISATKIPLLLHKGFWPMAHEARVDCSMLLGCLFLVWVGGGTYSVDKMIEKRFSQTGGEASIGRERT